MSSAGYAAELVPSRFLRLAVWSFGCGALVLGALLVLSLPVVAQLKTPLCLLWLASAAGELAAYRRGMSRIGRIRIRSERRAQGIDRHGAEQDLQLLPGSVVLDRVAWLRMRFEDGLEYGEVFTGHASGDKEWRHLLVIWRQGGVFGRPRRS